VTTSNLFAALLLPRALTLGLDLGTVQTVLESRVAEPTPVVESRLVFTPTDSLPVGQQFDAPSIALAPSRAELASRRTTAALTPPVSAVTSPTDPEPDGSGKRTLVQSIAEDHDIDWRLLEAVWQIESGKAWRTAVRSSAGAQGPMQFMPGTWRRYGTGDVTQAPDALRAGAKLLAANGAANGNIDRALLSYNHAGWYVTKVKRIMESI
jgi:soluble lytic murein transglycosylase-like protein